MYAHFPCLGGGFPVIFWFLFAVTLLPDVSYFIYLSLRKNSFINQQNLLLTKLCYLHVPLQHLVKCLNFSAGGVCNAPINSKLQHPPPRAHPGHLTVHRAQGGENLNVALKGWGI